MKGHLHNLFEVLPEVLDETTASAFSKIVKVDLTKEKKRGFEYRLAAILVLAMLKKRSTNPQIIQLFETIATISGILYSNDKSHSTANTTPL